MNAWRNCSILILVFALSGCSLFSPVNTNQTRYQLTSIPCIGVKPSHRATLLVSKPETSAVYNTTQIAYRIHPYQIAYFAKNRWADTPANMLQPLMVQTLQNTHYYHAVISQGYYTRYDYMLNTQLIELQQDFTQQPSMVKMTVRVQLIQANTARVIRAKQFSVVTVAPQNTPLGGVIAANQAVAEILRKISGFCTH